MAKAKKKKVIKKVKKKANKKVIKKPIKKVEEKSIGKKIGKVTHYYTNISVGVVELSATLKIGDKIRIKGATSDFTQKVDSMQIEQNKVEEAKKGQSIGLKVKDHVREHDVVYKL